MKQAEKMLLIPEDKYSRIMEKVNGVNKVSHEDNIPPKKMEKMREEELEDDELGYDNNSFESEEDCEMKILRDNSKNVLDIPKTSTIIAPKSIFHKENSLEEEINHIPKNNEIVKDNHISSLMNDVKVKQVREISKPLETYVFQRDLELQKNDNLKQYLKPKWLKF